MIPDCWTNFIQRSTGSNGVYEVVSGYRSPPTNARLRQKSGGVAKRSLHMQGRAIDVRLSDVSLANLRESALAMKAGGVGVYRKSNFLHLDTGRFRTWQAFGPGLPAGQPRLLRAIQVNRQTGNEGPVQP